MDISQHCGAEPKYIMTRPFELVDNLVFGGLLYLAQRGWRVNTRYGLYLTQPIALTSHEFSDIHITAIVLT